MNEGDPLMMGEKGYGEKERVEESLEEEKYMGCYSVQCGVNFIGIYIILDLLTSDVYYAWVISQNEYFQDPGNIYFLGYCLVMLP